MPAAAEDTAKIRGPLATGRTETVRFADPHLPAVRVVRGATEAVAPAPAGPAGAPPPFPATPANTEIVSFGDGRATSVAVVRGAAFPPARPVSPLALAYASGRVETVRFADPHWPQVDVVRGAGTREPTRFSAVGLFGAASTGELDRVAFAVDGVESGHGLNLAMWRPELAGPQGPMQVSAAAALDVGGGDRFDMRQNRLMGRAYLALLYRRYGSWPDAIAAYNWGPANLDAWIAAGRPIDHLPLETARYLNRVLRDAFLAGRS